MEEEVLKHITSSQNSLIKELRLLKSKKYRDESGLFFIEGDKFVDEALTDAHEQIRDILISESYLRDKAKLLEFQKEKFNIRVLSDRLFNEVSDTQNSQGIIAVVKKKNFSEKEILVADNNFIVILDALQDPGNMGTIIRTADAGGVTGVILGPGCVDLYNPKVLRSTMGSIFHIPVCISENIIKTIEYLKQTGIVVYASHLQGTSSLFEVDISNNVAIIIGNESSGIKKETASAADILIKIPMPGRAESLNASIAAGLIIFEVVRKRVLNKA